MNHEPHAEIWHFFVVYEDLDGHKVGVEGFGDRREALRVIRDARSRATG